MENGTPQPLQLLEPASPEALLPGPLWQNAWFIAAVLLVLLAVAFLIWRLRPGPTAGDEAARRREEALAEAKGALDALQVSSPRETATALSLLLRRYLARAAEDPALFETHEEFISRQNSLKALSDAAREACAKGFARLATLKYAAEPPPAEATALTEECRGLLDTLHRGFES